MSSESDLQITVVTWLQLVLPLGSVIHHSPNEGRHRVQYRVKQKRLGVRAGWPDLEIFVQKTWWRPDVCWSPIFIELKTQKGRVSPAQKAVQAELTEAGCHVQTCRSIDDVQQFLEELLNLGGQKNEG